MKVLLFLVIPLLPMCVNAAPNDPTTEATLHQLNEFVAVGVMVVMFALGAMFGHMR